MQKYAMLILGITLILTGCAQATGLPPTQVSTETRVSETYTLEPTATQVPPTLTPVPTSTEIPKPTETLLHKTEETRPKITKIEIDGDPSDWKDYEIDMEDSKGDSEAGFLDLTSGYAFVNQDALYFLINVVDPDAPFVQFDIRLGLEDRRMLISWAPGDSDGFIGKLTPENEYKQVGPTGHSTFAFDSAFEGRIDLRDFKSPEKMDLLAINVMVGECCEYPVWRDADTWWGGLTKVINEVDPSGLICENQQIQDEPQFNLPDGYVAENIYAPPAPGIISIDRSESGIIYLGHYVHNSGVSIVDPKTGEVKRILDVPNSNSSQFVVGGPDDSAFIGVLDQIWQVFPDGCYQVWGTREARPQYYVDGKLLGISHDGTRVVEIFEDGSTLDLATGFSDIYNIVADADGQIYISEWEKGDVVRINPDGTKDLIAENILTKDPVDLALDDEGNLFLNSNSDRPLGGFVKVDTSTGAVSKYNLHRNMCTENPTDFIFTEPGKMLFVDPTYGQITWGDLDNDMGEVLVSNGGVNTHAMVIGPDDALYIGTTGCSKEAPAQVIRMGKDGARTIFVDGLIGEIRDLAFDSDGGLYISVRDEVQNQRDIEHRGIYYFKSDSNDLIKIPGSNAYFIDSMTIDPKTGNLFASEWSVNTLFEFSLSGLVAKHPIKMPKKPAEVLIDFAPDGTLYAYVSEWERRDTGPVVDRWIFSIDIQTGESTEIFQYPHDGCCVMGNMTVDASGAIWALINPEFEIYRVDDEGNSTIFAQDLPIDSAAIAVNSEGDVYFSSPDGIYRICPEP